MRGENLKISTARQLSKLNLAQIAIYIKLLDVSATIFSFDLTREIDINLILIKKICFCSKNFCKNFII